SEASSLGALGHFWVGDAGHAISMHARPGPLQGGDQRSVSSPALAVHVLRQGGALTGGCHRGAPGCCPSAAPTSPTRPSGPPSDRLPAASQLREPECRRPAVPLNHLVTVRDR